MKAWRGSRDTAPLSLNLGARRRRVPALTQEQDAWYPLDNSVGRHRIRQLIFTKTLASIRLFAVPLCVSVSS